MMNARDPKMPGGDPDRAAALDACRAAAANRLERAVTGVMDEADDALFAMADKAETNAAQALYFDAMREVRLKRPAIEGDFQTHFLEGFDRQRAGARQGRSAASGDAPLGLLDMDELEESLAVDNMAAKFRELAGAESDALDQRMAFLLGGDDLARDDNPVGPKAVCAAFRAACGHIESGIEVKLIVLKLFDRFFCPLVASFYEDLNRLLVEHGVLPELPQAERRPRPAPAAHQGETAEDRHAEDALVAAEGAGDGVFAALQRVLGRASGGRGLLGGRGGGSGAGAGGAGAGGAEAGSGGVVLTGGAALAALTQLQQGDPAGFAGTLPPGYAATAVTGEGTYVNVLHDLRGSGALGAPGSAEAATLDVVALMFDYILADRDIPDGVKAQIARLQIPLLKVALLDKSLFSRRGHPARQLLDTLAAAGVGLDVELEADRALMARIEGVVQRVLDEFGNDLGLFDTLLQEFQGFLERQLAVVEGEMARVAEAAVDAERRTVAEQRADEELAKRLKSAMPAVVQEFLQGWWRQVLIQTCLEEGRGTGNWKLDVETMDILLWSLAPKATAGERRRLVGLLPELLRRVKDGAQRVAMPETERRDFTASLAPLHAHAVSPPGDGRAPPVVVMAEPPSLPDHLAGEEQDEALEPDLEYYDVVGELDPGTWIEFQEPDGEVQLRLAWISSISGRYLFTNRQGIKAAERSRKRLAWEFQSGIARLVVDEPLFERALTSLMDALGGEVP